MDMGHEAANNAFIEIMVIEFMVEMKKANKLKFVKTSFGGLFFSALLMIPAFLINQKNDDLKDSIFSIEWCEHHNDVKTKRSYFTENTPECIEKEKMLPELRANRERYETAILNINIIAGLIASACGIYIIMHFLLRFFRNHIAPITSAIRKDYNVGQAAKKIDKYRKLLDDGVLTQEQFDKMLLELQKSIVS